MQLPDCFTHKVQIAQFQFDPGDFTATGPDRCIPTIRQGQSLKFVNDDASPLSPGDPINPSAAYMVSVFHTVTACQDPCGLNTGISYPLANGSRPFRLRPAGAGHARLGQAELEHADVLKPGLYTFYCRIHPLMRGVFRVL